MLLIAQGTGRCIQGRLSILSMLLLCTGLSACASRYAYLDKPEDDYRAADDVLRRLDDEPGAGAAGASREHLAALGLQSQQLTVEGALELGRYAVLDFDSDEDQAQKRAALLGVMAQTRLESRVTVKTEKPGATVCYQLITEDESHRFDDATPDWQSLPIGIYYIWTQRNGWQSSPKEAYRIVEPHVQIFVHEGQTGIVYASSP